MKKEIDLKDIVKDEKKVLDYIIRGVYELKKLISLMNKAELEKDQNKKLKLVNKILNKHRRGLFGCEERVEKRLYSEEKSLFEDASKLFKNKDFEYQNKKLNASKEIFSLLNKLGTYNSDLVKLCAKNGEIEISLNQASKDINKIEDTFNILKKAMKDIEASDIIVKDLIDKTKNLKAQIQISGKKLNKVGKLLLRGDPVLRIIFDKEFRRYIIKKAPKLAPVIVRAIMTEGSSLLNPKDLCILLDFAINDPSSPKKLKEWGNNFLRSDKGKKMIGQKNVGMLSEMKRKQAA